MEDISIGQKLRSIARRQRLQHRFSHYNFDLELHPEDDVVELEREMEELHLD